MNIEVKNKIIELISEKADYLADSYDVNYDFNAILTRFIENTRPDLGVRFVQPSVLTIESIYQVGNTFDDVEERNEVVDKLKQRKYLLDNGYNPFADGTTLHDDYEDYIDDCGTYTDATINYIEQFNPELYSDIESSVEIIIAKATNTRI